MKFGSDSNDDMATNDTTDGSNTLDHFNHYQYAPSTVPVTIQPNPRIPTAVRKASFRNHDMVATLSDFVSNGYGSSMGKLREGSIPEVTN